MSGFANLKPKFEGGWRCVSAGAGCEEAGEEERLRERERGSGRGEGREKGGREYGREVWVCVTGDMGKRDIGGGGKERRRQDRKRRSGA